jgi:hypothetical protein
MKLKNILNLIIKTKITKTKTIKITRITRITRIIKTKTINIILIIKDYNKIKYYNLMIK